MGRRRRVTKRGRVGSGARGHQDGVGAAAQFNSPSGVTITPDGATLLVADQHNHSIRKVDLATRAVTTLAGSGAPTPRPTRTPRRGVPWAR